MEPITREEYYLAKIAGTWQGKTPEPVTIEEYYLATMAGDYSGNTPQPVTRLQYYMAKVAGVWGGSIPAPVTRLEYYWAAIASGEGKVFPPVTREEHFLVLVADAYSVVLTVVTGNPALLEGVKGNRFTSLTIHGKSTQGSTTGAQLFDVSEVLAETWLSTEAPVEENAVGYWTSGYIPVKTGNYICSSKDSARGWTYDADKNGLRYIPNSGGSPIPIKEGEAFIRVTGANTDDPQNFMFNEGNSIKPYEPYTGGKPSPSPQYPQEIESVGQSGEIGVDVYGGNLIKSPFESSNNSYKPGYTFTQNGVTFTVQNDMGIKVAGMNTSADKYAQFNAFYKSNERPKYPAGTYTFSEGATVQIEFASIVVNKDGTFTINEEFNVNGFYIPVLSGQSVNKTVYPMLNIGSTALPYEPYKPAQTLIIPTPNGLPGIPVSSEGNYTDEKGQQWVCDDVDFKKGVYVQRVAKEIPKTSFIVKETFDNEGRYQFTFAFKNTYKNGGNECLISHGIYCNWGTKKNTWAMNTTSFYYSPAERTTADKIKEKILSLINSDNPLTFLGQLETPIEIPLTTEQLAKYKALRTYSPTTTVINDAGAGMSVGYAKMK